MRMRATVAGLTSRAAPMAASVQLGPASPWLAFSRMRAWVRALAGATPRPIMVCNQARSSSVRTTTCRLRTSASCSVGPPEPHEDEGQPPTTQLKADELLGRLSAVWCWLVDCHADCHCRRRYLKTPRPDARRPPRHLHQDD